MEKPTCAVCGKTEDHLMLSYPIQGASWVLCDVHFEQAQKGTLKLTPKSNPPRDTP